MTTMSPAMNATLPQNIPQTTQLLLDMKNKGQLQSYVAQHKDDPGYASLLSLAMTINQTSDEAKALAAQPPQQTISNQALASLASRQQPMAMPQAMPYGMPGQPQQAPQEQPPEMSGIAQAPAPNMQHMADGGIVGYAEGGHIDSHGAIRFQNLGSVPNTVTSAADLRNILNLNGEYPITTSAADLPNPSYKMTPSGVQPTPNTDVVNKAKMPLGRYGAGLGLLYSAVAPPSEDEMASLRAEYNALPAEEKARRENPGTDGSIRHLITSMFSPNKPTTGPTPPAANAPASTAPSAPEQPPTSSYTPPTSSYTPSTVGSPPTIKPSFMAGLPAITPKQAMENANQFYDETAANKLTAEYKAQLETSLAARKTALEDMIKNRPELGKKEKELLDKQTEKDSGKAEDLKNFSLIEAGLAMMSGTSPYAMVNIGQGGLKGLQSYKEGKKELDKASDLRDQAYAHIADMNDAQKIGDQNLALQHGDKAAEALNNFNNTVMGNQFTKNMALTGIAAAGYNTNQQMVNDTNRTNAVIGSQTNIANANLQMDALKINAGLAKPPPMIEMAQWLGGGRDQAAIDKGMAKLQEVQQNKQSLVPLMVEMAKDPLLKSQNPELYNSIKAYTMSFLTPNAVSTPSGKVRQ